MEDGGTIMSQSRRLAAILAHRAISAKRSTAFQRSASNAARDRNSSIKAHQINLKKFTYRSEYQPSRGLGQPFWVCGGDTLGIRDNRVAHTPRMPAGWNIRVTTFDFEGRPGTMRYFLAYEPDKEGAIAVRAETNGGARKGS